MLIHILVQKIEFDENATVEEKCQRKTKLITKFGNKVVKELNFVSDCSDNSKLAGFSNIETDSDGEDEVKVINVVKNYRIQLSADE